MSLTSRIIDRRREAISGGKFCLSAVNFEVSDCAPNFSSHDSGSEGVNFEMQMLTAAMVMSAES